MGEVDTSLFKPELVFFDVEAEDAERLFNELDRLLRERGYVKDTWLEAILARERSYPTGLEFEKVSVAIPHVDPEHIVKPYIAVVVPKGTVSFSPMADMVDHPVEAQLVVNLGLLAHAEGQVAVLQAMMEIFMSEDATNDILAQTTGQGMVSAFQRHM